MYKFIDQVVTVLALIIIFILAIGYLSEPVKADTSIQFGGISTHLISKDTNTWFHNAIIIGKGKYAMGYLKNSYGNDSFMVTIKTYEKNFNKVLVDVYVGAVRGYDRCYGKFDDDYNNSKVFACPLVVINATLKTNTVIEPVISLWGDAVVLTGRYKF